MLKAAFILAGTLGYIAFPFDFVPDLFPVVGQMDDLGILTAGVTAAYKALKKSPQS